MIRSNYAVGRGAAREIIQPAAREVGRIFGVERERGGPADGPPLVVGRKSTCSQRLRVLKVSQRRTSPDSKPTRNQRTRWAEEPWVKESGTA